MYNNCYNGNRNYVQTDKAAADVVQVVLMVAVDVLNKKTQIFIRLGIYLLVINGINKEIDFY